jgi:GPH family glycoside/pentoside/hexuronide:cation symporter/oligogalacturonide transporter
MSQAERIAFAAGDCFGGGSAATIAVLYLFYLTDILGLPPGLAGLTILVSKVWDALNHPLMGLITDRTRSRWGRRRPWIFVGAVLVPPAMAALWAPIGDWESQAAKLWFVILAHLFWTTIASIIAVPYGSLSTEVTVDPAERNQVNVLRLAFATLSAAGSTLVMSALVNAFEAGNLSISALYLSLVLGFGLFFALPLLGVAVFTHERAPVQADVEPLTFRSVSAPLKVPSFRSLTVLYLCPAITIDIVTAVVLYYALYAVPGLNSVVFLAVFVVVTIGLFPVLQWLVKRVDKNVIYYRGLPVSIVAMTVIALYPSDAPVWPVYLMAGVMAVGVGAAQIMVWVMFPDVVDAGEIDQGARNAGSFSGLLVLVRALASAVAIQVLGLVLEVTGYVQSVPDEPQPAQPESAVLGIRLAMLVSVFVLMGLAYITARRYPLTRTAVADQHAELLALRLERGVVDAEGEHHRQHASSRRRH